MMSIFVNPIKTILWASTISANSAFSDKKPTPGWMASAPTNWAAVIIAGIFKYDFEDKKVARTKLSNSVRVLESRSKIYKSILLVFPKFYKKYFM